MKGLVFILFSFLFSWSAFPQLRSDTLRFYYPINQYAATPHQLRIDSFCRSLKGKNIRVKILGYADFISDASYNITLSQKRCDGIKEYFLSKYPSSAIQKMVCQGMGERFSADNGSGEGEARQRRVDFIFEPVGIRRDNRGANKDTVFHNGSNPEKIEKLNEGESLELEGLNFYPGRHFIVKESENIMNDLLIMLQKNPSLKIEIQGHICCLDGTGDGMDMDTGFQNLSVARAKAVNDFLIKNGIEQERLSYKGFGHAKPKFWPETTLEEEQANRRVEIMVIDK